MSPIRHERDKCEGNYFTHRHHSPFSERQSTCIARWDGCSDPARPLSAGRDEDEDAWSRRTAHTDCSNVHCCGVVAVYQGDNIISTADAIATKHPEL